MSNETQVERTVGEPAKGTTPPAAPCIVVIFGASGDLTKRLLMPAFYNLTCDGLLPKQFAIVGTALDPLSTEQFRARLTGDIKKFNTRPTFDESRWGERPLLHGRSALDFRHDLPTHRAIGVQEARQGLDPDHRGKALWPRPAV